MPQWVARLPHRSADPRVTSGFGLTPTRLDASRLERFSHTMSETMQLKEKRLYGYVG